MFFKRVRNVIIVTLLMFCTNVSKVFAAPNNGSTDDPLAVSNDFSEKVLSIVQGPILKVLAAVVLLVGIAGLLQGKQKLSICCGLAFLLLLFLPILLGKV